MYCYSKLPYAKWNMHYPIQTEEHWQWCRTIYHRGGAPSSGYNNALQSVLIESCGFSTYTINHHEEKIFTVILMLRKHHKTLSCGAMFILYTKSSSSPKRWGQQCETFEILRGGWLSPQAVSGNEKLVVSCITLFRLSEPWYFITIYLREISITIQEFPTMDLKLSRWC